MNKNIFVIAEKSNIKSHKIIKRIILKDLLKHKKLLPHNLLINLVDNEISNKTGIFKEKKDGLVVYQIDLNVAEVYDIYRHRKILYRDSLKHIPQFKKFKTLLLFVLYHELGHYKLKHLLNNIYNYNEIEVDIYSLKILGLYYHEKQLDFNFYGGL